MKRTVLVLLSLLLFTALCCGCNAEKDLCGIWRLESYHSGSNVIEVTDQTVLIFSADGTGTKSANGVLLFTFVYHYDGTNLTIENIENVQGATENGSTQKVTLSGDTLDLSGGSVTAHYIRQNEN